MEASVEKEVPSNLAPASVHRASVDPAAKRVCRSRGDVYPGRGYPSREGGTRAEKGVPVAPIDIKCQPLGGYKGL